MFYEIHVFIALYISVASYKGKFQKSGHFCGKKKKRSGHGKQNDTLKLSAQSLPAA